MKHRVPLYGCPCEKNKHGKLPFHILIISHKLHLSISHPGQTMKKGVTHSLKNTVILLGIMRNVNLLNGIFSVILCLME